MSESITLDSGKAPGKAGLIGLWILRVLLALAFFGAAMGKLTGQPMMVQEFDAIGAGQWLRYLTGSLELVAAVLLLIPRAVGFGALLICAIMAGAIVAHLTRLHTPPVPPAVLLVLAGIVAYNFRKQVFPVVRG